MSSTSHEFTASSQQKYRRFLFQGVEFSHPDSLNASDLSLYLVEGNTLVIEGLSSSGGGDDAGDATASSSCLNVSSSSSEPKSKSSRVSLPACCLPVLDVAQIIVKYSSKKKLIKIDVPIVNDSAHEHEEHLEEAAVHSPPLHEPQIRAEEEVEKEKEKNQNIDIDSSQTSLEQGVAALLSADAPEHIRAMLDDAQARGLDRVKVARDLARRALNHAAAAHGSDEQHTIAAESAAPAPAPPAPPAAARPAPPPDDSAIVTHACMLPPRVTSLQSLKSSGKQKGKDAKPLRQMALVTAQQLKETNVAVVDGFLSAEQVSRVRREIAQLEGQYESGEIWVGKNSDAGAQISVASVRGDRVLWVDKEALARGPFHALREAVRNIDKLVVSELSKRVPEKLRNVSERSDPMLSIYPAVGARFQKHVDNTAEDGRALTVLCYLNDSWESSMGGQLRVFNKQGNAVDVCPSGGRLAMFYADEVPHEVLPSYAKRDAFTLWYYDANERAKAVARSGGGPGAGAGALMKHHPELMDRRRGGEMQARAFLKWLMTENLSDISDIADRVGKLSDEACEAVGAVLFSTSSGTADDIRVALLDNLRGESSFRELRSRLSSMGLV